MDNTCRFLFGKKIVLTIIVTLFVSLFLTDSVKAQTEIALRRPVSPEQPMWLIHIDTWNYADPQKIIDLIPQDIRPYVVMNISLSISHDVATSQFKVAEYGYEIAKSWLRVCAQNQMWTVIQHSSGGYAQFSDSDLTVYEEFFNEYPNLLGFSYAEQFWGFDDSNDPLSPAWTERMDHFANLLKLSNKYGGYLVVSWCGNQWSPSINPIAMMKRNPKFAKACQEYTKNYILCEKYTQTSYQSDMESICLGAYLSGYSGNYGIRYDDTGWTDSNGVHENFSMATAGAPHLEHMMLTGETVIDGPELIWTQCFKETNQIATTDGYYTRNWTTFSQFDNVSIDLFRKVLDGTVRIPSRKEVVDRTKVVIIQDVNSGTSDEVYSTPETLFEGLYRMDNDGNLVNNTSFFKKTGRYPTIPTVFQLDDDIAQSFQIKVNQSGYSSRWSDLSLKTAEFNNLFAEEYTGDLYAGRHENGWVIYNPYKSDQTATASIPFKYNTCDHFELNCSQYTSGVIKEYTDKINVYLTNFNEYDSGLKLDEIKIYGSTTEPTYSYQDRGSHVSSSVSKSWLNGVFTLSIWHNGPLDLTIDCSGSAISRLTSYTESNLITPDKPAIYAGPRQYEAECFDFKNINKIVSGGQHDAIRNYTGQGYLYFGRNSSASVRYEVQAVRKGKYQLKTRYSAAAGSISNIDIYVNDNKVESPTFTKTQDASTWNVQVQDVELNAGENKIEFKANSAGSYDFILDNIVITQGSLNTVYHFEDDEVSTNSKVPAAELIHVQSGSAGVVSYTDNNSQTSNYFKTYSAGLSNGTGVADLDMFTSLAKNYSVVWKEYYTTTGAKKGMLLRATGENGSCPYAEGMKQGYLFISQNNDDNTVTLKPYIANSADLSAQPTYTSSFKVMENEPCWYRAKAIDNQFVFECSKDSVEWEGSFVSTFTDQSYPTGSTEIVWGLNSNNFDWGIDNITFLSENITVSKFSLDNFKYSQGRGPSVYQTFAVSGSSVSNNIEITSTDNFEVSLNPDEGYDSYIEVSEEDGVIQSTPIYVRMKSGLPVEEVEGSVFVSTSSIDVGVVSLKGEVTPQPTVLKYNFSDDVATTTGTTPPAKDIVIGIGNSATAGVVSYTDADDITSNVFTPYGTGQRNATGVANLDLFKTDATDYSVTWKQCVGSESYKVGVLLRVDPNNVGGSSSGYVQGIMNGYLFIVYTAGYTSEFRIYKSTSDLNLAMLKNTGVNTLLPESGQPIWYRASVSGNSSVSLTFEYSTDGVNWNVGTSTTDNVFPTFSSGASQIVWGLAVTNVDFYLDDITFNGFTESSGTLPELIETSVNLLSGFNYVEEKGPSFSQQFAVSAEQLTDDVFIEAPTGYEVSIDDLQFSSSLTLNQSDGQIPETDIYVRMKSGLTANSYMGDIYISSTGILSNVISLSGIVEKDTGIGDSPALGSILLYSEYFTLMGQRIYELDNHAGIFIVRKHYSDGTIITSKILLRK